MASPDDPILPAVADDGRVAAVHRLGSTCMRGIAAAIARAGISPGAAVMLVGHSLGGMTAAAGLPAGDPSYTAWREPAQGFLDPDNQALTSTYAITRKPGP